MNEITKIKVRQGLSMKIDVEEGASEPCADSFRLNLLDKSWYGTTILTSAFSMSNFVVEYSYRKVSVDFTVASQD